MGDNGHSIGLLQLHDQGMGAGMGDARFDPETNLRKALSAHVKYLRDFGSVEAALTAHNAGGGAVGSVYARGGSWEDVVHHVSKNGNPVYVADVYTRPIMATAAKYR